MNDVLMQEGRRYLDLKVRKDELEDELKAVKEELAVLSGTMVEQMDDMELDRFSAYGTTFSIRRTLAANCLAENKEELFGRLREQGHGHLIREDVNSRTLAAFVREQLDDSGAVPEWMDGIVDVYYKSDISARKAGRG